MHKLYNVKDKLIRKIEEYDESGDITRSDAEEIKILSSAADHICNICKDADYEEGDYSERGYSMNGGYRYPMDGGGYRGGSYARRRDSMGRYSRDGYSRHDGMADELRELMKDAPESVKHDLQRVIDKIDQR